MQVDLDVGLDGSLKKGKVDAVENGRRVQENDGQSKENRRREEERADGRG